MITMDHQAKATEPTRTTHLTALLAAAALARQTGMPEIYGWAVTPRGVRAHLRSVDTDIDPYASTRARVGEWATFLGAQVHEEMWGEDGWVKVWCTGPYRGESVKFWGTAYRPVPPADEVAVTAVLPPGQRILPHADHQVSDKLTGRVSDGELIETEPRMFERVSDQ